MTEPAITTRGWMLGAAVALPPLVLAIVGITHPTDLTAASALYWRNLHIGILPVFPLLGFAPWLMVRVAAPASQRRLLSWVVGVLAFIYAAFYTALDVLAGIGAGGLRLDDMGMAVGTLYGLGDDLGLVGSIALVAACAITGAVVVRRAGLRALPGAIVVVIGSVLFLRDHIFFPFGVAGQVCLMLGWIGMILALRLRSTPQMSANDDPFLPVSGSR